MAKLGNPFRTGRTLVIPHGGGDALFPENTLYAYENSIAMGGDVIDIDVQLSGDGVPIAFHDDTLQRTTNGTGLVTTKPYTELAKLDAGWQFLRGGRHPYRGKGLRIPTVEAILRRFPTTLVTLDLKDLRTVAVDPICEVITRLRRSADVYVGVDTTPQVERFRTECPTIRTSATDEERRAMRAARAAGDTRIVIHQIVSQPSYRGDDGTPRITPSFLAFSHSKGIAVFTWVVDDPKDMKALIDMGVDGIYTRRPDIMLQLLGRNKAESRAT